MKFSAPLLLAFAAAGVSAFAQGSSDPNCLSACAPLSSATSACGYDLVNDADGEPTTTETTCFCNTKNFVSDYLDCYTCLNQIGEVSDSELQNMQTMDAACEQITGKPNGAASAHGAAGVLASLAVTVGFGICGLMG